MRQTSGYRQTNLNRGQPGERPRMRRDYDALGFEELYELARRRDVVGRVRMTREQIIRALRKH